MKVHAAAPSIPWTGTSSAAPPTCSAWPPAVSTGRVTIDEWARDYSGTIAAVGRRVTGFTVGEPVFGLGEGSLAEYLAVTPIGSRCRSRGG